MADSVGAAILEIRTDLNAAIQDLGTLKQKLGETADSTKNISQLFSLDAIKDFGRMGVEAIGKVAAGIVELGLRGAAVNDVKESFASLSAGTNETAATMLGALRAATLNTISDFELMQTANKALGAGLKLSAADMGTLAAGAKMLADRTGGDTKEAFDALTKAMVTGKTKGLAEFGFGAKDAGEVLGMLRTQLNAAGEAEADFGDTVDQSKALLANWKDNLASAIAGSGALVAGLQAIAREILKAFGGDKEAQIRALTKVVNGIAITLLDVAKVAVTAARYITDGFYALRFAFNAVLETLFTGLQKFYGALASVAERMAAIPVIGAAYRGMAQDLRASADSASSFALGFKELKDQAVASSNSTATALGHTTNALDRVRAAMVAAGDASVASANRQVSSANAAAGGTIAAAAKIAAAQKKLEAELKAEMAKRQKEIASLLLFEKQATDANYAQIIPKVKNFYATTIQMAKDAGFASRGELEATAAKAEETYARMLASGLYTESQLRAAKGASAQAHQELDGVESNSAMAKYQMISAAASTVLKSIFGKSKAAAYAAAVIDTAAAVVSSFKNAGGYPWGLIPAAAMLAAGIAQIRQISSTNANFSTGTPGLDYQSFGREQQVNVHGDEAIIPRGGGHALAREIAAAGGSGGNAEMLARLDRVGAHLAALPRTLVRAMRTARVMAMA